MIPLLALVVVVAAEAPRLLVADVPDAPSFAAGVLDARVVEAARTAKRFRVPAENERALTLLRARDAGLTCAPASVECAARQCAFSGFDLALVAIPVESEGALLEVSLVECAEGRTLRRVRAPLDDDDALRARGVSTLVAAALGESVALTGTLDVRGPNAISVDVDDVPRGHAPLALSLDAGAHDVTLRGPSGPPDVRRVTIPLHGQAVVEVAPSASTADDAGIDLSTIGFVSGTTLALSGATLAAIGAAGALAVAPRREDREAMTATAYNGAVLLGRAALVVTAVSLAASFAGAGVALFFAVDDE